MTAICSSTQGMLNTCQHGPHGLLSLSASATFRLVVKLPTRAKRASSEFRSIAHKPNPHDGAGE